MESIISYCGLACDSCPIHLATLETDKALQFSMRVSIARQITCLYKKELKPEDITDCDGCLADNGRIFSGCKDCGIRKCANAKKTGSCAVCNDYACGILKNHFLQDPDAEIRLEEIRMAYSY